ncbi:hypothetical protein [Cupriavidus sp. RAF12]
MRWSRGLEIEASSQLSSKRKRVRADEALYKAKRDGRNRVTQAGA